MDYCLYERLKSEGPKHTELLLYHCSECGNKIWGVWEFYAEHDESLDWKNAKRVCTRACESYLISGHEWTNDDLKREFEETEWITGKFTNGKYTREHYKRFIPSERKSDFNKCKKFINSSEYKQIGDYHKEFIEFVKLKKCPICGKSFKDEFLYSFGYFDELVAKEFCKDYKIKRKIKDIRSIEVFSQKELANINIDELKVGEKFLTPLGLGTFTKKDESGMFHFKFYSNNDFESIKSYVDDNIEMTLSKKCEERFAKITNEKSFINVESHNVKIEDDKLKEYLSNIVVVEKNIFCLSKRLKELYLMEIVCEQDASAVDKIYLNSLKKSKEKLSKELEEKCEINPAENISSEMFPYQAPKKPIAPKKPKITKPEEPILGKYNFFNKKKVIANNEILLKKYENSLKEYKDAFEKYNNDYKEFEEKKLVYKQEIERLKIEQEKKVEAEKTRVTEEHKNKCLLLKQKYEDEISNISDIKKNIKSEITPEKLLLKDVRDEINVVEKIYIETLQTREKLYSYNVIFGKYRDFVAVSTFYEYLVTGRCNTLEGADGAYNLYEKEIRMNMIISNLSKVILLLEEIRDNQYTLYTALNEMNNELSLMNNHMKNIGLELKSGLKKISSNQIKTNEFLSEINKNTIALKENSDFIAYNTAKTAFYAKRNSEITAAIGFMMALN